ncbi:YihY/virulence factor BrkB family protein [Wohlfahrtiimonas larvae]|uniref:Uncharacterized protein n=1 Tax=Wohlfahrtiimonas larvae TaxID=1157986 RepID=A0ABP9MSQ6_9GAMM|nr:YihY/virulence factor BrkB family protein [Wohlfahrtiimonas larvae]
MNLVSQLTAWLWSEPSNFFKYVCRLVYRLIESVSKEGIRTQAQALAYTTILSIVPFMAVSFSILKSFGVYQSFVPTLNKMFDAIGIQDEQLTSTLIGFVDNVQVGLLGSIGFLVLFYTVVSLISTIESAFNSIWGVERNRHFAQRFSYYLVVVLIGPVVIFSLISLISSAVILKALDVPMPDWLSVYLGQGFTIFILTLCLAGAYSFLTNAKVRIVPALIGGLVAAIAWHFMGKIFTDFIATSNKYSGIYSGFASVILFFIWMDLTWLIVLVGNRLTFLLQYPQQLLMDSREQEFTVPETIMVNIAPKDKYGEEWIVQSIHVNKEK